MLLQIANFQYIAFCRSMYLSNILHLNNPTKSLANSPILFQILKFYIFFLANFVLTNRIARKHLLNRNSVRAFTVRISCLCCICHHLTF